MPKHDPPKVHLAMGVSWIVRISNTWFLVSPWVHSPNTILISSAVLAQLAVVTNRQCRQATPQWWQPVRILPCIAKQSNNTNTLTLTLPKPQWWIQKIVVGWRSGDCASSGDAQGAEPLLGCRKRSRIISALCVTIKLLSWIWKCKN